MISGISKELWTNTLKNKNNSNTRSFHFQVTIYYYILVLNNVLPCHRDRQTVSMADLHIQQTDKYSNNLKLYIGRYMEIHTSTCRVQANVFVPLNQNVPLALTPNKINLESSLSGDIDEKICIFFSSYFLLQKSNPIGTANT